MSNVSKKRANIVNDPNISGPDIYKKLESTMVTHRQLMTVEVQECGEPLVTLNRTRNFYLPQRSDMIEMFGEVLVVRESVRQKLENADAFIRSRRPEVTLLVTYGYRTLEIQTLSFLAQLQKTTTKFYKDPYELYENVHRLIAVPTVAGHPTGGAVDVLIVNRQTGLPLNFGPEIYDFTTKDIYALSPYIGQEAQKNRKLLRDAMMTQGFAPYDGEWWHFSYGDKEWAFYYKQPHAIYEQKKASEVEKMLKEKN